MNSTFTTLESVIMYIYLVSILPVEQPDVPNLTLLPATGGKNSPQCSSSQKNRQVSKGIRRFNFIFVTLSQTLLAFRSN